LTVQFYVYKGCHNVYLNLYHYTLGYYFTIQKIKYMLLKCSRKSTNKVFKRPIQPLINKAPF
jgi:hypothetical protein